MSKVSKEFGEAILTFLKEHNYTFRAAAFQSGVSAAYWKDMSDGRVPSEEIISRISDSFDDLDENVLRLAAGYAPNPNKMDALQAVDIALRHQKDMPEEGRRQILEFVKDIQKRYGK